MHFKRRIYQRKTILGIAAQGRHPLFPCVKQLLVASGIERYIIYVIDDVALRRTNHWHSCSAPQTGLPSGKPQV